VESVQATHPFYIVRLLGGLMFFSGMLIMAYNLRKSCAGGKALEAMIPVPVGAH
jgi:cytochrome c oxidase cbb3-type subunit 1